MLGLIPQEENGSDTESKKRAKQKTIAKTEESREK
jgi:hypothetical protein